MRKLTASEATLIRKIEDKGLGMEASAVTCFLKGITTSLSFADTNRKDLVLSFADEIGVNLEKNKLPADADPP